MDIEYILSEQKELTKLFNKGIYLEEYDFGEHICGDLYYSHALDENGHWYLIKETVKETAKDIFLNVKRDYIKEKLNIFENEFISLLKDNKLQIFRKNILDYTSENNKIIECLSEEYIIYNEEKYKIIILYLHGEKSCLGIDKL